jgi:hypothetical protein
MSFWGQRTNLIPQDKPFRKKQGLTRSNFFVLHNSWILHCLYLYHSSNLRWEADHLVLTISSQEKTPNIIDWHNLDNEIGVLNCQVFK